MLKLMNGSCLLAAQTYESGSEESRYILQEIISENSKGRRAKSKRKRIQLAEKSLL